MVNGGKQILGEFMHLGADTARFEPPAAVYKYSRAIIKALATLHRDFRYGYGGGLVIHQDCHITL